MLQHVSTIDMNRCLKKQKFTVQEEKRLKDHYESYQKYYEVTNN